MAWPNHRLASRANRPLSIPQTSPLRPLPVLINIVCFCHILPGWWNWENKKNPTALIIQSSYTLKMYVGQIKWDLEKIASREIEVPVF